MPSINSVLIDNVRAERHRRRWSQADLGNRMGWARATVGEVENGRRLLTIDELTRLCRIFGLKARELMVNMDPKDLDPYL